MGDLERTTAFDRCPICQRVVGFRHIFARGPSRIGCLECVRDAPDHVEPEPKIAKGDDL